MIGLKKYICKRQSSFFSHAFTIILMNCNVCILQLQKKKNKKNEKKQTNKNPKQNQKKIKNPKNKT